MSRRLFAVLACLVLLPAACRSLPEPTEAAPAAATPEYPRSFRGPALRLNLFEDGSYFLSQRDAAAAQDDYDDLGRWSLGTDGGWLQLVGGGEGPRRFGLHPDGSLEPLDEAGKAVVPGPADDLRRDPTFAAIEPALALRGEFTYLADAARFRDCGTGADWPVAMEADYGKLERAYGDSRVEPGKPLLAVLQGRLVQRPRVDGVGQAVTVVVDRFIRVVPGQGCGPATN